MIWISSSTCLNTPHTRDYRYHNSVFSNCYFIDVFICLWNFNLLCKDLMGTQFLFSIPLTFCKTCLTMTFVVFLNTLRRFNRESPFKYQLTDIIFSSLDILVTRHEDEILLSVFRLIRVSFIFFSFILDLQSLYLLPVLF